MQEVMNCRLIWKPQLLQNEMNNSRFSATGTVYRHTVLSTKSGSSMNRQNGHQVHLLHARETKEVPVRQTFAFRHTAFFVVRNASKPGILKILVDGIQSAVLELYSKATSL